MKNVTDEMSFYQKNQISLDSLDGSRSNVY